MKKAEINAQEKVKENAYLAHAAVNRNEASSSVKCHKKKMKSTKQIADMLESTNRPMPAEQCTRMGEVLPALLLRTSSMYR